MGYSLEDYLKAGGKQIRESIGELLGVDVDRLDINIKKPTFTLEDRVSVAFGTAHQKGYILDARLVQISQIHCIADAVAAFTFKIFENDSYTEEALIYSYDQSNAALRRFDDLLMPNLIYYTELVKGFPQLFIEIDKTAAGTLLFNFKVRGFIGSEEERL